MNKAQLLAFIQSLPDDMEVQPVDISECAQRSHEWKRAPDATIGTYQRDIENTITLRLDFRTCFEGQFKRTYVDPEGSFFNLRRVI